MIFTSHTLGHLDLVVRMSRKHNYRYAYVLRGTVDRRGYGGQQKGTICDARGPYPSISRTLKPVFHRIQLIHCDYITVKKELSD